MWASCKLITMDVVANEQLNGKVEDGTEFTNSPGVLVVSAFVLPLLRPMQAATIPVTLRISQHIPSFLM